MLVAALSAACGGAPALRPHARVEHAPLPETVPVADPEPNPDAGAPDTELPAAPSAGWDVVPIPSGAGFAANGWMAPLPGFAAEAIISQFGDSRDGGARRHEGIDIRAPRGTTVLAPFPGRVIASGHRSRSGNMVIVLAEDGRTEAFFAHMDSRAVERGQWVDTGQRLGTVGDTGNARGTVPHLHFEVRVGAGPVDPYPLLVGTPPAASGQR